MLPKTIYILFLLIDREHLPVTKRGNTRHSFSRYSIMARVEHFKDLDTNIDNLYNSIKEIIQKEKSLKLVSEVKGEMNGRPLRSITAVNTSLVVLAGTLGEITISIGGRFKRFCR